LGELEPQSRFDARRFRMNVIVDTPARGFVENAWVGRTLAIGHEVRLGVALPDPRCVSRASRSRIFRGTPGSSRLSPTTTGSSRLRLTPAPASTPSIHGDHPQGRSHHTSLSSPTSTCSDSTEHGRCRSNPQPPTRGRLLPSQCISPGGSRAVNESANPGDLGAARPRSSGNTEISRGLYRRGRLPSDGGSGAGASTDPDRTCRLLVFV
jgi:hypothetical protein